MTCGVPAGAPHAFPPCVPPSDPATTARSQHAEEAEVIPVQMAGYTLTHDADCLPPASREARMHVRHVLAAIEKKGETET